MGHPLPSTAKNVRVSRKFVTDLALATRLLQASPRRLQQKLLFVNRPWCWRAGESGQ